MSQDSVPPFSSPSTKTPRTPPKSEDLLDISLISDLPKVEIPSTSQRIVTRSRAKSTNSQPNLPSNPQSFLQFKNLFKAIKPTKNLKKPTKISSSNMTEKYRLVFNLVQQIPVFSGTRTESLIQELHLFLKYCIDTYNSLEKDDQATFLKLITGRLRGDAFLLSYSKNFATLEEFQEFLTHHYMPRVTPADLMNQINTCRQGALESLLSFSDKLEALALTLKDVLSQTHDEENLKAYFEEIDNQVATAFKIGVYDPIIQNALITSNSTKLQDLIEVAQNIEKYGKMISANRKDTIPNKWNQVNIVNSSNNNTCPSQLYNLLHGQNFHAKTLIPNTKNSIEEELVELLKDLKTQKFANKPSNYQNKPHYHPESSNYCDFCERPGHSIKNCPTKRNSPFCRYCHQYGHVLTDCAARNQNNYRNNQKWRNNRNYSSDQGQNNQFRPNQGNIPFKRNNYNQNTQDRRPWINQPSQPLVQNKPVPYQLNPNAQNFNKPPPNNRPYQVHCLNQRPEETQVPTFSGNESGPTCEQNQVEAQII